MFYFDDRVHLYLLNTIYFYLLVLLAFKIAKIINGNIKVQIKNHCYNCLIHPNVNNVSASSCLKGFLIAESGKTKH